MADANAQDGTDTGWEDLDIEGALASRVAALLGKTIGEDFFAAALPPDAAYGTGLALEGRESRLTSLIDAPTYTARVFGRYASRRDAWRTLTSLQASLPLYGGVSDGFRWGALEITDARPVAYQAANRGRMLWHISCNLRASVYGAVENVPQM